MDEFKDIAEVVNQGEKAGIFAAFGALLIVWRMLRKERVSYSRDSADIAESDSRNAAAYATEKLIISLRDEVIRLNKSHEIKDGIIEDLHKKIFEIESSLSECQRIVVQQSQEISALTARIRSMNDKFDVIRVRGYDSDYSGYERRKEKRRPS